MDGINSNQFLQLDTLKFNGELTDFKCDLDTKNSWDYPNPKAELPDTRKRKPEEKLETHAAGTGPSPTGVEGFAKKDEGTNSSGQKKQKTSSTPEKDCNTHDLNYIDDEVFKAIIENFPGKTSHDDLDYSPISSEIEV